MRQIGPSVHVVLVCVVQVGCAISGGTSSTVHLAIDGTGQVVSRDGVLDCSADANGATGTCETAEFISWTGDASSTSYQLCATPAAGFSFDTWRFVVAADCPACSAGDPEMGSIEPRGNEADVVIDLNAGYDVDETVTARFVPTASGGAANSTGACW